jgi:hypothetical protein
MLFLLMQITIVSPEHTQNVGVSNFWTQYIQMLPDSVPVPTLWTEEEIYMLTGTSLEVCCQRFDVGSWPPFSNCTDLRHRWLSTRRWQNFKRNSMSFMKKLPRFHGVLSAGGKPTV